MNKLGIIGMFAAALSVCGVCFATGGFSTNPTLITTVEVDKLNAPGDAGDPVSTSSTFLTFSETPSTKPSTCTSAQSIVFGTPDHIRNVTSIATAAMLAGKRVTVYYATTGGTCFTLSGVTYAKIAHISVAQ